LLTARAAAAPGLEPAGVKHRDTARPGLVRSGRLDCGRLMV